MKVIINKNKYNHTSDVISNRLYLVKNKADGGEFIIFVGNTYANIAYVYFFEDDCGQTTWTHKSDLLNNYTILEDVTNRCTLTCDLIQ